MSIYFIEKADNSLGPDRSRWCTIIWNHPKPIITQVHGYCVAGGVEIAVMSDICVVAADAKLGCSQQGVRAHGHPHRHGVGR